MNLEPILIIVGSFTTIGLAINAFFLKGIYTEITGLKVDIAKSITDTKSIKVHAEKQDEEILKIRGNIHDMRNEISKFDARLFHLEKELEKQ